MLIVEGMDGSGKTSLVERLSHDLVIPIHKRAARSIEGPRKDLFEWAQLDVGTIVHQTFSVYDRHPMISEYVYGPVLRDGMDDRFHSIEATSMTAHLAANSMVIFCDPGIEQVEKNVQAGLHMPGVTDRWEALYWTYKTLMHHWPGQVLVWDYRFPDLYAALKQQCVQYFAAHRGQIGYTNDHNA